MPLRVFLYQRTKKFNQKKSEFNRQDKVMSICGSSMAKKVFIKFVSEPKNDLIKSIIGLACTNQAITDGHEVSVFFAGSGTRLLDSEFIEVLNLEMGPDSRFISELMENIISNATLYCSFASVKATLGHSEGDEALIVPDNKIKWSGPPGVISLATNSEVQLTY